MDEPVEPRRPTPAVPGYLPRMWKAPAEPEPTPDLAPSKAKKKRPRGEPEAPVKVGKAKKKKPTPGIDDGTGATKLEETPILDTYEARQKARWIIGGVLGGVGLITLLVVIRIFRGGGEEERPGEVVDRKVQSEPRPNPELEARNIVENARQADKIGRTKAATDLLDKVAKNYPTTAAGREAMHALDRNRRKQPLFGADIIEQATGPKPPPPGKVSVDTLHKPDPSAVPGPVAPVPPRAAEGPDQTAVASATAPGPTPTPRVAVKPLPSGFREKPGATIHPSGWPMQILSDRDGGLMVLVPGGTFLMGREDGEPVEGPAHRVSLSTYYIDQHEVTVRQFVQFLKETGRPLDAAKLTSRETSDPPVVGDLPVVNVSAKEARAYCNWSGKRLPTEAQWEYAARSGDGRVSYWNGEIPRKDLEDGTRAIEPVMSLPSDVSPFGAFDMGANAWEWTSEFWDSHSYQQIRNTLADPTGPKVSPSRIAQTTVKGGSKIGILTWRDGQKSEMRLPYLGFRGALPVEGPPVAKEAPVRPASPNPALPGGVQPF